MKQNMINEVKVRGYVFNHTLQAKVTGPNAKTPGVEFIQGDINVAKDIDATEVIPVHFSYVTKTFKNGNTNTTYETLMKIIQDGTDKTLEHCSDKNQVNRVRIDGAMELNDYFDREDNLRSPKRVRGSFVHLLGANEQVGDASTAIQFKFDTILFEAGLHEVENGDDYYEVRGYAFAFNNAILPVTLSVCDKGVPFFEKLGIDQESPYFGTVWGIVKSNTIVIQNEQDDSDVGFGELMVQSTTRSFRSWEITGAMQPQELDEDTITFEELQEGLKQREVYLAGVKQRAEDYRASQQGQQGFPASNPTGNTKRVASSFKF